jgi:hypothetical protein
MEYRQGERLCDIWYMLNAAERAHIENECLKAIHALRAISIRLDDPGKHNVLYSRESGAVTLLDFEVAAPLAANTFIPTSYEMRKSSVTSQARFPLTNKAASFDSMISLYFTSFDRLSLFVLLQGLSAAHAALPCLIHKLYLLVIR